MSRAETADLSGRRVLVTGGTGFIGGRVVEKLVLEHGANPRVLTRSYANAPRIARFPVELVRGDVTEMADVRRAAAGCDVIVHCAYGSSGSREERHEVNVGGTANVLRAGAEAGVDRIVHMSTVEVYDPPDEGVLTEASPREKRGDPYGDSKLEAERLALEHAERGAPVTVVQPTVVYGPWAPVWTADVLRRMREGPVALVDGGEGLCNAVYVDDVADAVLAASTIDDAVGEAFLVSSDEPVTWAEYYGRFEEMLGGTRTVSVPAEVALDRWEPPRRRGLLGEALEILGERSARERLFSTPEAKFARKVARVLLPRKVREPLRRRVVAGAAGNGGPASGGGSDAPPDVSPDMVEFYRRKVDVRIDKARRVLGYEPAYSFERGMELTEQWARWANLLGDQAA